VDICHLNGLYKTQFTYCLIFNSSSFQEYLPVAFDCTNVHGTQVAQLKECQSVDWYWLFSTCFMWEHFSTQL